MKKIVFSLMLLCAAAAPGMAQEPLKLPSLSPASRLYQEFSTSSIEISYSRPSMRGRAVFGDVVAYGNVWRTGANAATRIKIGEDLMIGGQEVKAGEYAFYTIPGQNEWEVIINKSTGNWGAAGYDKALDVARFKVPAKKMNETVQTFTIQIADITFNTCSIELMWEKTKVVIPVKANNEQRLNASITKAINEPAIPYQQAANYYYETGQNLDKAFEYANKAIEQNPKAFWLYALKARIAQKMGNKAEAVAAARKSMELAKGSAFEEEYKRSNQKIIDAMK